MATYPIQVKRFAYRGSDPRKRQKADEQNRIATKLETYINALVKSQTAPIQMYFYHQIATETGFSENTVRELCFSIDGGHNGFKAIKPSLGANSARTESCNDGICIATFASSIESVIAGPAPPPSTGLIYRNKYD
ncbi:hypothetical protein [Thiobacillus sp.]